MLHFNYDEGKVTPSDSIRSSNTILNFNYDKEKITPRNKYSNTSNTLFKK